MHSYKIVLKMTFGINFCGTVSGLCCLCISSGIREDADGSVTYCLMGNELTIVADEEYLTISSNLDLPHSQPSSLATHNAPATITALHSQTSSSSSTFTSQNPSLGPCVSTTTISPISLPSDTPTTCSLAHPAQPLITQPLKAKHHPLQQGLLQSHYKVISKDGKLPQPPPPPTTPITAQVISSMPPCAVTLPPSVLPTPGQSHIHLREEQEKKDREYRDEDEEDDEEEEESRRKASL